MSNDEIVVLIASLILSGGLWGPWIWRIVSVSRMCSSLRVRLPVLLSPLVAGAALGVVLRLYADDEVRSSWCYLALYGLMGMAWTAVGVRPLRWLGLSARDDVAERGNAAASWAIAGAVLGLMLAFAGANIGEGPGWWVVVFSAFFSTASFLVLWILLAKVTDVLDVVTIDRDVAAGVRLGAFFVAAGAILGGSVAGNWVSVPATVSDFAATAWPVLPLLGLAAVFEWAFRPRQGSPRRSVLVCGLAPGVCYLAGASAVIHHLGAW